MALMTEPALPDFACRLTAINIVNCGPNGSKASVVSLEPVAPKNCAWLNTAPPRAWMYRPEFRILTWILIKNY